MDIVIVGHVDHGKSTLIGRLLADTDSLAAGRLEAAQAACAAQGKPFEYASLLDALKDEQEHGITIDAARVFFRSARRSYLIHDAPGHVEFVRNMVTGAARAEAAVLVVDGELGVQENTRRHAYLLGLLGIPQIVVVVTKMDRVGWSKEVFERVGEAASAWLARVAVPPRVVLPASGSTGGGVARSSENLWWFRGPCLLEALDAIDERPARSDAPFRLPVQAVYKWVHRGDDRRILAGTVQAGRVHVGDEVVFYPAATRARVRTIEAFHRAPPGLASAGETTGLTLDPEVYVPRGSVVARADERPPQVGTRLAASLFWLGRKPLQLGQEVRLRIDTAAESARLESIARRLDAHTLEACERDTVIERFQAADVVLQLRRPVACDPEADGFGGSRYVLVDGYDIAGGGLVRRVLADPLDATRRAAMQRNFRWERGLVDADARAERLGQRGRLILVSGPSPTRKDVAKALEAALFAAGRTTYYLGLSSFVHGIDSDVPHDRSPEAQAEHFRRLGEMAHLMVDAGILLVVSADVIGRDEWAVLQAVLGTDPTSLVWVGEEGTPGSALQVASDRSVADAVVLIGAWLRESGCD